MLVINLLLLVLFEIKTRCNSGIYKRNKSHFDWTARALSILIMVFQSDKARERNDLGFFL